MQRYTLFPSILVLVSFSFITKCGGQTSPPLNNGCSQYLRGTHRMGANVQGRLEIPTDDFYPKYKLRVGFSSRIHHMTIRQSRAKDMGNHRDFLVDPMEMRKDGKLQLDVFIRLHRFFGPFPRLTRIVYNNVLLCGDALDISEVEDGFEKELFTSPTPSTSTLAVFKINSTTTTAPQSKLTKTKTKTNYLDEDDDIFLDEESD